MDLELTYSFVDFSIVSLMTGLIYKFIDLILYQAIPFLRHCLSVMILTIAELPNGVCVTWGVVHTRDLTIQ